MAAMSSSGTSSTRPSLHRMKRSPCTIGTQPRVDAHRRLDAEGAGDDVAARVGARLVLADVAGVDQLLHVAVVDGGSMQLAVAQQVGARVADVDQREAGDVRFVGAHHHRAR